MSAERSGGSREDATKESREKATYPRLLDDRGRIVRWPKKADHALLRREMFDRRLMNRTNDGRTYWI